MQEQENITPVDQYVIDFITSLRKENNLSQKDIGNIIGLSRVFITKIESENSRAKYNIRHINALADHFGMSPREFLPEKAFPVDGEKEKVKPVKKTAVKKKVSRRSK